MRTPIILTLLAASISLAGCHSVPGNVIPKTGPSMEQLYDNAGVHAPNSEADESTSNISETDLSDIRAQNISEVQSPKLPPKKLTSGSRETFRKLPNPELTVYVYPHFAGTEEVPIPGYYTEFNAYEKTHYALPSD